MKYVCLLLFVVLVCPSAFSGTHTISSLPFTFTSTDHSGDPEDTLIIAGTKLISNTGIGTISASNVLFLVDEDTLGWGVTPSRNLNVLNLTGNNIRVRGGYYLHMTENPFTDSGIFVFDVAGLGVTLDSIKYADLYGDGSSMRLLEDGTSSIQRNGGVIVHMQGANRYGLRVLGGVFESKVHAYWSRCWYNVVIKAEDLRAGPNIGLDTLNGDTAHIIVDGATILNGPHMGIMIVGRSHSTGDLGVGIVRNCNINIDARNTRYTSYQGVCFSSANPYTIAFKNVGPGTRAHNNTLTSGETYGGSRGVLIERGYGTPENPVRIDHNIFDIHEGPNIEYPSVPIHHVRIRYGPKSIDVDSNVFYGTFDLSSSTLHTGPNGHFIRLSADCAQETRRNDYDAFTLLNNHLYWVKIGSNYTGQTDSVAYTSDGTATYQEVSQGMAAAIEASTLIDTFLVAAAQTNTTGQWRLSITGSLCKPFDVFSSDPNLSLYVANVLANIDCNIRIFNNRIFPQVGSVSSGYDIKGIVFDQMEYDSAAYSFNNYMNVLQVAYQWAEINREGNAQVIYNDTVRYSDTVLGAQNVYSLGYLSNNFDCRDNVAKDMFYLNGAEDTDIIFSSDPDYMRSIYLQSTLTLFARGTANGLPIVNASVFVWDQFGDSSVNGDALFNGVTDSGGMVSGVVSYYYAQRIATVSTTDYNTFKIRYIFGDDTVWTTGKTVGWTEAEKTDTADFAGVSGTGTWGAEGEPTLPDVLSSVVIDSLGADYEDEFDAIRIIAVAGSGVVGDSIIITYGTSGYVDSSNANRIARPYEPDKPDTTILYLEIIETDTLYVSYWTKLNTGIWTSRMTTFKVFTAVNFVSVVDSVRIDSVFNDFQAEFDSIRVIFFAPAVDWGDSVIATWGTSTYTDSFPTQTENRLSISSGQSEIDTADIIVEIAETGSLYLSTWLRSDNVWGLRTQSTIIFYISDPDSVLPDKESPSKITDLVIIKEGVIIIPSGIPPGEKTP